MIKLNFDTDVYIGGRKMKNRDQYMIPVFSDACLKDIIEEKKSSNV